MLQNTFQQFLAENAFLFNNLVQVYVSFFDSASHPFNMGSIGRGAWDE